MLETTPMIVNVPAYRRVKRGGRDWFVGEATMIVPGVLAGSKGALYYPPEEIQINIDAWNGIPLTAGHPTRNGNHVSARDPEVMDSHGIGHVYNTRYQDKLVCQAWFDAEKTKSIDERIYNLLNNGRQIELSTGLFTDNHPSAGTYNGRNYDFVARNYRPDHLAVLVDQKGACSISDGCGIGVNAVTDQECPACKSMLTDGEKCAECEDELADNAQPKSLVSGRYKTGNAGTGKGEVHEAAQAGHLDLKVSETHKLLGADAEEQMTGGADKPSWAANGNLWSKAAGAAEQGNGCDYARAVAIYQALGGSIVRNQATDLNFLTGETDMNRDQTIQWLTANCDCWKGKEKVLTNRETFSDDDIKKLLSAAQEQRAQGVVVNALRKKLGNPSLALNDMVEEVEEMPPPVKKKGGPVAKQGEDGAVGLEEGEDEEDEEGKVIPAVANQRAIETGLARSLGFESVSHMRATLNSAKRVEAKSRNALVRELRTLAEVSTPKRKRFILNQLERKPSLERLEEMRLLVGDMPVGNTREYRQPDDYEDPPDYSGQGYGGNDHVENSGEGDVLELPTTNQDFWANNGSAKRVKSA